ncbi:MAG TPA: ABC transporter ATP-binding protein, partial [Vulgatibacter sp.]
MSSLGPGGRSVHQAPRLEARALRIVFDGGREVLRGVDLELRAGEVLGLVGPNGAGKSTLSRAMAGLLPPGAGEVRLDGAPIGGWRRRELARRIAYLSQEAPAGLSFTA